MVSNTTIRGTLSDSIDKGGRGTVRDSPVMVEGFEIALRMCYILILSFDEIINLGKEACVLPFWVCWKRKRSGPSR